MSELIARIERHYSFSKKEFFKISATAFVAAFGLTISNGWGIFNLLKEQNIINYFANLIIIFIMCLGTLLIHVSAQKIASLKLGYVADYAYWMNGFLISTVICFVTFGFLPLFFTGAVHNKVHEKLRMGRFRYGVMQKDAGVISFAGPLANMLLAMIAAPIYVSTESNFIFAFIAINLLMATFSLLPIPVFEKVRQFSGGTSGFYIFVASRWAYVLCIATVAAYSVLVLIAQVFSIILALIVGIVAAVAYYRTFEVDKD